MLICDDAVRSVTRSVESECESGRLKYYGPDCHYDKWNKVNGDLDLREVAADSEIR